MKPPRTNATWLPWAAAVLFLASSGCAQSRREVPVLDGVYQVRWRRDEAVAGVLSLEAGTYRWAGRPPALGGRTFAFVVQPTGRYTVEPIAPASPHAERVLAVVDFAPGNVALPEAQRRVEVRSDDVRGVRFFHSVDNELEMWSIETLPEAP